MRTFKEGEVVRFVGVEWIEHTDGGLPVGHSLLLYPFFKFSSEMDIPELFQDVKLDIALDIQSDVPTRTDYFIPEGVDPEMIQHIYQEHVVKQGLRHTSRYNFFESDCAFVTDEFDEVQPVDEGEVVCG